ncbi:hypothetical protein [Phenylobacterium aquaticum]|uniref:hypothetical protein n=1 Tax=Phenylobacterium aquaticum TaxID=1763816 RepID=UPI0026EE981E|nr:hypothetical protein [Phenylobacterium aquaticum]
MTTRTSLLGFLLGLALLIFGASAPVTALAGDCHCTPTPPCCTTPTPPCCTTPTPPCCTTPTPPVTCCDTTNNFRSNINVNVSTVSIAIANAASSAGSSAGAGAGSGSGSGSTVYYGGGGGGGGYAPPMASGIIQGLSVDTGKRMKRTAYQATRTRTRRVVIQSVCLDDRTIPHPASQATPDRDIEDAYDGELYRCIAGTWLQATIAEYKGEADFSGGQTLTCHKGDALYHAPGGKVECRPQKPARDCNERSLLRRFGAGIKILTMTLTETYTAYREEEERTESAVVSTTMSLDGGVGGTVY